LLTKFVVKNKNIHFTEFFYKFQNVFTLPIFFIIILKSEVCVMFNAIMLKAIMLKDPLLTVYLESLMHVPKCLVSFCRMPLCRMSWSQVRMGWLIFDFEGNGGKNQLRIPLTNEAWTKAIKTFFAIIYNLAR
jgi:hypothetical protein